MVKKGMATLIKYLEGAFLKATGKTLYSKIFQ
jgi:hypothetical protein